jgi:excisionase family DNA binding protein
MQELHKSTPPQLPTFLTTQQVASMFHLRVQTVHKMVYEGRIPYHKAGGRLLFLLSELLEWSKQSGSDIK